MVLRPRVFRVGLAVNAMERWLSCSAWGVVCRDEDSAVEWRCQGRTRPSAHAVGIGAEGE